jgi:hypothetical protein
MDTTTKYTNQYRNRVKRFSDASNRETFREDILKTSSDLYMKGKLPQLLTPRDETTLVGVTGNRDAHALTLNLLTHHPEYGIEETQAGLIVVNGLWIQTKEDYGIVRAKIAENPENIRNYLKPSATTLLQRQGDGERYRWQDGGIFAHVPTSRVIPCSYYIMAENGEVVLPKFQGYEYLGAGYPLVNGKPAILGWDMFSAKEDNPRRVRLEGILAEIWDNVKKDEKERPIAK